jgi:hypothetical protein
MLRCFGGHIVVEAEDGKIAWELFQALRFDFVVTNWLMDPANPDKLERMNPFNGDTFARRIRASGSTVPIAVRSGSPKEAQEAFAEFDVVLVDWLGNDIIKLLTGRDITRRPAH